MKALAQMTDTELGDEARRITLVERQIGEDLHALVLESRKRNLWVTAQGVERRSAVEKF